VSEQLQFEDEEIPIVLRRAWDRALRMLATRVNKPTFEAHIRTLKPLALSELMTEGRVVCQVVLGVPSAFTKEWVEKRHTPLILGLLEEILDREVRLQFSLLQPQSRTFAEQPGHTRAITPSLFEAPTSGHFLAPTEALSRSEQESAPAEALVAALPEPQGEPLTLEAEIVVVPTPRMPLAPPKPRSSLSTLARSQASGAGSPASTATPHPDAPLLNPRYTFEAFVTGRSNRLAEGGAHAVAQAPGEVYNPLFLYGPPGIGKTHLMHAIGHAVMAQRGPEHVCYVSGEAFTTAYVKASRENKMEEFRRRWRNIDVFLLDDIQFIAGKDKTNEEFFHTFNALYQTGKQIVISSDRSPRELKMMDERLRSRFESGLIADIAPPDLETRLAILQKKAELERMRIPDDVLLYMARLVQSNIRTLEGALVKLIAYASMVNSPVTEELASDILERYFASAGIVGLPSDPQSSPIALLEAAQAASTGPRGRITADVIQSVVARRYGLDPEALKGKKRDKETARARQVAMLLMRELTETSLPGIGQFFGGRDHTTVMHACTTLRDQLTGDDTLRELVTELTTEIRNESSPQPDN
jgi:chromosomal replication initiator protein